MKSLSEIRKEREDSQAKYEKEKQMREATGTAGKVSKLREFSGVGYAIKFVHSLENSMDLMYHIFNGDDFCSEICHEHYDGEKCPYCESISTKHGKRFATGTKFFLAHVYNLVGQEFTMKDSSTGKDKVCKWNPLKLIGIPHGKKEVYIKPFLAEAKAGRLQDAIFLIKRTSGSGWDVPEVITEAELKELVGPQVPLAMPTENAKYAQMDKRTLWKLMLTAIPNAKVVLLLGPEPVKQDSTKSENPFANPQTALPEVSDADIDAAFN